MAEESFASLGKTEAIKKLYEGTPYKAFDSTWFECPQKSYITTKSGSWLEGIDFDLEYFPLKHLGYKCITGTVGELYAEISTPKTACVSLGVSSKLDFEQISELWNGMVTACKEHKIEKLSLELKPSLNGLSISVSATGITSSLMTKRRPAAKSMDLICISDNLGAAFFGQQVLARRMKLEDYRQHIGAYLKPEINPHILEELEESEIVPSMGYFIKDGLADTLKQLTRDCGLGAKVYADKIPFAGKTFDLGKELDLDPVSAALSGGDDYCLLFTIPIGKHEKFRHDFQTFDIIGHLAKPEVGTVIVTPDGLEHPIKAQGWSSEE